MNETIHVWHHCHNCNAAPITGKRHHCESCPDGPDNDLCESCYDLLQKGKITHPLADTPAAAANIKEHHFETLEGKPAGMYEKWLEVKRPTVPAPAVADGFVLRPIFEAGGDSVIGGYSFVAQKEGTPVLLTALHVMDEMIKKQDVDCSAGNTGYSGRELPAVITGVGIYHIFAERWMFEHLGTAGPMLVLPGAGTGDEEPFSSRDIAAFQVKDTGNLNPAPLAKETPKVGDPVWLAIQVPNSNQRTLKAVIVEITENSMVFIFNDLEDKTKYTSGAPVLNQNGEVVGINVGGGKIKNHRLGHANHVGNIRRHLETEVL